MLEAIRIEIVRERDEEIVVIVMARAEKRSRLSHQPAVSGNLFVGDGQGGSAVRSEIQVVRGLDIGSKRYGTEILSRQNRRVYQCRQGNRREQNLTRVLLLHGQGGCEFPALGKAEAGLISERIRWHAGGIKRNKIPFQHS